MFWLILELNVTVIGRRDKEGEKRAKKENEGKRREKERKKIFDNF